MFLTVNGKDYQLEYTIEASMYSDCTKRLLDFMADAFLGGNNTKTLITAAAEIPDIVLTTFYAGLLEHHGVYGDGSVKGLLDAKALLKQYFKENPDATYVTMLTLLMDQMGTDGFFQRIGLEELMKGGTEAEEETKPTKSRGRK